MLPAFLAPSLIWRAIVSPVGSVVLALGLFAGVGWGIERHAEVLQLRGVINSLREKLGILESERAVAERTALQAIDNNRRTEQRLNARNQENSNEYEAKLQERDRSIAALRAERKRLRDQITAYSAPRRSAGDGAGSVCQPDERPERLGRLLAESADLLNDGRDLVAALSAQVVGLQKYVNDVCLAK